MTHTTMDVRYFFVVRVCVDVIGMVIGMLKTGCHRENSNFRTSLMYINNQTQAIIDLKIDQIVYQKFLPFKTEEMRIAKI